MEHGCQITFKYLKYEMLVLIDVDVYSSMDIQVWLYAGRLMA